MSKLHVTQACFLKPVLDPLKGSGNYDQLLRHSGLDKFNLDIADNYLPTHAVYAFLQALGQQEGLRDIAATFSEEIKLVNLAQWGEIVAQCSNILSAMQFASQYDQVILSQERSGYQVNGNTCIYWQRFIDAPASGRDQVDFISFALALNGMRLAAGPDWAPLEIHLQSHTEPDLDHLLPPGSNTRIRLGQPATAIVFPTRLLFLPMLSNDVSATPSIPLENAASSLTGKIESLLDSCKQGFVPNMSQLSYMLDISLRTLQRRLSAESSSHSLIIDQ